MARLAQVSREPSASSSASSASNASTGSIIVLDSGVALDTPASTPDTQRVSKPTDTTPTSIQTAVVAQRRRSTRVTMIRTPKTLSVVEMSTRELAAPLKDPGNRTVSGETLVEKMDRSEKELLDQGIKALDLEWGMDNLSTAGPSEQMPEVKEEAQPRRKSSRSNVLGRAASALVKKVSVLGKRSRGAMESGKDMLQQALSGEQKRTLRPRGSELKATGPEGEDQQEPAQKKQRMDAASASKIVNSSPAPIPFQILQKRKKLWLSSGLYVGQDQDFDARLTSAQQKRRSLLKPVKTAPKRNSVLPLPMFKGKALLENGRIFELPFDVFSPAEHKRGQLRAEWRKAQKNTFVGDAATDWKRHKALPSSRCTCTAERGCDDACQNKYMYYECDSSNCNLGDAACGNRQFANLKQRRETKRKFDIGYDIEHYGQKGFGVRACRTFEPNQIIMEYAGEIITQDECESRMRNQYRENKDFYLMTFDQNMIIDATAIGSSARYVNHSCEPNCNIEKWTVAGQPRMALFAGDSGIMTGDELTYDYNFDNFSQKSKQQCHCGTPSCRGFLEPRTTSAERETSQKSQEKEKESGVGGILTGAKRKLGQLVAPSSNKPARTSSVLKKKNHQRRVTVTATVLPVSSVQRATPKRITSTSTGTSTLVEKRTTPPSKKSTVATTTKKALSSPSASSTPRGIVKKKKVTPTVKRRHTFDALTRAASNAKSHLANTLRSSKRLQTKASNDDADADEEGLEARENDNDEEEEQTSKSSKNQTAAGMVANVKRNIVGSVRGPRRARAMKKYGINRLGDTRSVRLISDEDE